jgi:tRNA 2-thiouridine synthesizing protein E
MKQFYADPQDIETSGNDSSDRLAELAGQCWDRGKSLALAVNEGMDFNDKHWEVIVFLRNYYQEHGLPLTAGPARAFNKTFPAGVATNSHRRQQRPTQGSRLANLPTPASATDRSFGTNY